MNLKKVILSDISIEAKVSAIAILLDKELPKLTDQVDTVKKLKGEQGDRGLQGEKGNSGRDGKDGKNGRDGKDGSTGKEGKVGEDGVSVTDAKIDFDGSLVISLSSGKELNVGEVVAPDIAEKIKVISTMSTNGAVAILDEGTSITSGVKSLNFVGSGVTATTSGDDVTVTVAGGGGSGTVTSVAATAGTGISITGSPITTSGTLNITNTAPDQTVALAQGGTTTITGTYPNFTISSADQFQGTVTSVTGTAPVVSSGGATPAISMPAATTSVNGYLTSTDWTTFNNKGSGTVTSVGGTGTVNGITLTGTVTSSGNLTLGGTLDLSSPPIIGGTAPNTGNFSTVNLSAGTTTVAPLDFVTGTNLTTPAAGAWEYDGTAFYATPIASNRAVSVIEHFVARTGTKTMTSNTALQAIFSGGTGGLTSGALTVGASTSYFFEMSINVSAMSTTSGNMGFSIVGAGTATFTSAAWHAFGLDNTNQQTGANAGTTWQSTAGATGNIVTAAVGTAASAIVKGIFRINGAGTIIPSIQLTTASAAVIGVNTWFKCYPVGTNTVISVGNWA